MADVSVLIFLLLLLNFHQARAQPEQNQSKIISLGSYLSAKTQPSSWTSASGHFSFGFYTKGDGFGVGIWLVGEQQNITVWSAARDDPPFALDATLNLTTDGKLLIQAKQLGEKLIADTAELAASASMLETGNFVLYNKNLSIIWQSFGSPTDTILGGQSFFAGGNDLVSSKSKIDYSSGRFFVRLQTDGNLVAYPVNSSNASDDAYWSSNTPNTKFDVLFLNNRGLLYLNSSSDSKSKIQVLANSSSPDNQGTTIYRAIVDADGVFRIYSHHFEGSTGSNGKMEWSNLQNQCEVKGFCGLNSYCSGKGFMVNCSCFPGFTFMDENDKFMGCTQNFTEDVCERRIHYNLVALENIWWIDTPYAVIQMKKEDCTESCQEDCNCGAVILSNGNCNKFKLPLRYCKQDQNQSSTAFFRSIPNYNVSAPISPIIITKGSQNNLVFILAITLGSIACLCFVLAVSSFFLYRQQTESYRKLSENPNLELTEEFTLRPFSYDELEEATDGFKEELGRGTFGAVYKGTLSGSEKTVAIKRLDKVEEGEREFRAEITTIGRTNHRNLVRLLGFCLENSRKLLVYEYMSHGSLADFLFNAKERPAWKQRVRITLDIARGIHYLHEECEVCIIHCNIKPQNILMDDSLTAKISEFGLSNMGIKGLIEYSAPEWQSNELTSVKVDVYSFGIVLMEIICCRSSLEVNVLTADEIILSSWAYKCFAAGELNKLVDDENLDMKMMERMVKVGFWCIQEDPTFRPSMKNVILMLEGTLDVPLPPSPSWFPRYS